MRKPDFPRTAAYASIYNFILEIDNSIKHEEQKEDLKQLKTLSEIRQFMEGTELDTAPQRYANRAALKVFEMLRSMYTSEYLVKSFGDSIRLDYGTGHELNYLCYLYVLHRCGELPLNCIFSCLREYFRVVRLFIHKFRLEPAGSHGIWGLDDYQFLPFLFGSSELFSSRLDFSKLSNEYCYIEAVEAKKGVNMHILNILIGKDWPKINQGMLKMYDADVLRKSVITQHFIYGEYLSSDCRREETRCL
jgi:serine/threonine-protein phosphatase 2A activator